MGTMLLGTRVRGVFWLESLSKGSFLQDFPLFKIIRQSLNIVFVYKLLKKYNNIRYFVSATRLQSRLTGYVCALYIPVCLRSPLFSIYSYIYGVKISEATMGFNQYATFT
jgi:hypothetical protein